MSDLAVMQRFIRAYENLATRSRSALEVRVANGTQGYKVNLLGVMSLRAPSLIITAPMTATKQLLAVQRGTRIQCSWDGPGSKCDFTATVSNMVFEPAPILYLGDLHGLKLSRERRQPRAVVSLPAAVRMPRLVPVLTTDLSVGGALVATNEVFRLSIGDHIEMSLRVKLIGREYTLTLPASVASMPGAIDPAHPQIEFLALEFKELDEMTQLVLGGYVNGRLAEEVDLLSRTLAGLAA